MVKKIPHEQSRRNAARRRRKVAARHARAGHWGAQSNPMLHSGTVSDEPRDPQHTDHPAQQPELERNGYR